MNAAYRGSVEEVLLALADPVRQKILHMLAEQGGATATTLATRIPVTRQAIVKHLGVLERAGLVTSRRLGREVWYLVRPQALNAPVRWMQNLATQWEQRLQVIKRLAESADV